MSDEQIGGPGSKTAGGLFVGVGASAGGLDALTKLLDGLPAASGFVFVVVQHLDPRHPSLLAELLGRRTPMPVVQAEDGALAEPGHVYVIAPNARLTIEKGVLRVTDPPPGVPHAIDAFFRSLAEDQGEDAVAILLSGSGGDGTEGMRAVKERGGLTLAQSPETAQHDSMPLRAIEAGLVDRVLPVEQMPAMLLEHARGRAASRPAEATPRDAELAERLGEICALLRERTGHDFREYKEATLLRRVRRRVQAERCASVADYVRVLAQDADEAARLLDDLLIGVTHFFRDPAAFEALEREVLPGIVARAGADVPIRIWVAGCASGEEAYSLAILVREQLERSGARRPVQIFATDISGEAIAEARAGCYGAELAEHVSPERLERFFAREGARYRVAKELREMCIFSQQSLIRDPPFSLLDLIACRNVLIYLDAELQRRLVPLFHYGLRPGGYLFLGSSEFLAGNPELFETVDREHRILRRSDAVPRPFVRFPLGAAQAAARAAWIGPPGSRRP
jgi:two-component system CheB/CheR fusion protein